MADDRSTNPPAQSDDLLIGYREALVLRRASGEGMFYTDGYGQLFEAAMVCERLGLLQQGAAASVLSLTPSGHRFVERIPDDIEDGFTLEIA